MSLKLAVRRWIRSAGVDLVSMRNRCDRVVNGLWALLPETDLVFDVGANIGQFRDLLRNELGYHGRIVSFEPSPEPFAQLERRSQLDDLWDVYPWALGAQSTILPLNVAASSVMSSFRRADVNWKSAEVVEVVDVSVLTLDEVVRELGIPLNQRIILKVDTQGYDLEVLRGAAQTLKHTKAILSEVSQVPIYEGTPDMLDAIREMRSYGFDVAALTPIIESDGVVIEFDCLMIRR